MSILSLYILFYILQPHTIYFGGQLSTITVSAPRIINGIENVKILPFTPIAKLKEMVWPSYNKEDIKIFQWVNGSHWYAKLGNLDVVDPQGNQKWDTKKAAEQAAINFYKEMV